MTKRMIRMICITIINVFLSGTHFFKLKRFLLRSAGVTVGDDSCVVGPIKLGGLTNLVIGKHVWVGANLSVHGNGGVILGNNIDIAPDVSFITGGHEINYGLNYSHRAGTGQSYIIKVGNGCWLGARVMILGNTEIESGNVIAAGCLVNKSLPSDGLYAGVPAKRVRDLNEGRTEQ